MEEDRYDERTRILLQEPEWMIELFQILKQRPELLNQIQISA